MNTTIHSILNEVGVSFFADVATSAGLTWGDWGWRLLLVLGLIALSGFFVASEFAIERIRGIDLEEDLDDEESDEKVEESRGYRIARRIAERPGKFLSATRMGMTSTMLILGLVTGPMLSEPITAILGHFGFIDPAGEWVRTIGLVVSGLVVLMGLVVFGELIPKSIGIRNPVGTVLRFGGSLVLFRQILYPLSAVLEKISATLLRSVFRVKPVKEGEIVHSAEELQMLVHASGADTDVTSTEKQIVVNALELSDLCARDIMTPRSEVVALDLDQGFDENLKTAIDTRHTRFPIARGHLDSAIGMVHIKDMLKLAAPRGDNGKGGASEPSLMGIKRPLLPIPEKLTLDRLLEFFLKEHAHLALVVDEFGGTVGVVFLDDVLAELVGDIHDEFDEEVDEFHRVSDDEFFVDGGLGLYELSDFTDLELNSDEVSTIGGFVTQKLGHVPRSGEKVEIDGFAGTVTKSNGRRVVQLHFKRLVPSDESAAVTKELA
mgnify:CR=1 FL=1